MSHTLFIGDRAYSSWSLRAFLVFDVWGLPHGLRRVSFGADATLAAQMAMPPARTVPTLLTDDGAVVHDSLAISEELASRYPDAGIWPSGGKARATARTLAAEMHSGFSVLRNLCPMNLRASYVETPMSDALAADLRRLDEIWTHALSEFGGPWLAGPYSAADAFFAPVAARIATYNLPMSDMSLAYVARQLAEPSFRRWRAMALADDEILPWYERDHIRRPWPGPAPRKAVPVYGTAALNDACPYSQKPITHVLEIGGKRFGFCNAFCRDKTIADPDAWPAFIEMESKLTTP